MAEDNEMRDSNSYIIKDTSPDRVFSLLNEKINAGYRCLCVTRTNPEDIKNRYNVNIPIILLSNRPSSKSKDYTSISDIPGLKKRVTEFIKQNKKSAVVLDRIDYLINMYGFSSVLKFLYSLNDEAMVNESVIMVNVNPHTLKSQELSLMEQELNELPKPNVKLIPEFADDLYEIMFFVNNNEKISFKDVSKKFSITKTTTRKRINKLIEMGLLSVRKNGRNKILKITDVGRSIF
jgi:hypothetical protein